MNRSAEPAGSRRAQAHCQLDLNYTQDIRIDKLTLQLAGDPFNMFNKQTGYNYQSAVHSADFDKPRSHFDPRQFQLTARLRF